MSNQPDLWSQADNTNNPDQPNLINQETLLFNHQEVVALAAHPPGVQVDQGDNSLKKCIAQAIHFFTCFNFNFL
jgi:hypothetical protein